MKKTIKWPIGILVLAFGMLAFLSGIWFWSLYNSEDNSAVVETEEMILPKDTTADTLTFAESVISDEISDVSGDTTSVKSDEPRRDRSSYRGRNNERHRPISVREPSKPSALKIVWRIISGVSTLGGFIGVVFSLNKWLKERRVKKARAKRAKARRVHPKGAARSRRNTK